MMMRREFVALLGGAAVASSVSWPFAARAQQADRMRRVGVLESRAADDPEGQARLAVFLQGLQELGWTDGRNVRIDYRWAAADADRAIADTSAATAGTLARRDPIFSGESGWRGAATNNPYRADRIRECYRPGRGRLRREIGAPGRQRHWIYAVRIQPERKMARTTQRDCFQPGRICKRKPILP